MFDLQSVKWSDGPLKRRFHDQLHSRFNERTCCKLNCTCPFSNGFPHTSLPELLCVTGPIWALWLMVVSLTPRPVDFGSKRPKTALNSSLGHRFQQASRPSPLQQRWRSNEYKFKSICITNQRSIINITCYSRSSTLGSCTYATSLLPGDVWAAAVKLIPNISANLHPSCLASCHNFPFFCVNFE